MSFSTSCTYVKMKMASTSLEGVRLRFALCLRLEAEYCEHDEIKSGKHAKESLEIKRQIWLALNANVR